MKSEKRRPDLLDNPSIQEHVLTDECKVDVARRALLEEGSPVLVVVAQVLSQNVVHKLGEPAMRCLSASRKCKLFYTLGISTLAQLLSCGSSCSASPLS